MTTIINEYYSDPYFSIDSAASPQRSRPESIDRHYKRLSLRLHLSNIDNIPENKEKTWSDDSTLVCKSHNVSPTPTLNEKDLLSLPSENNEISFKKKKRFSIFGMKLGEKPNPKLEASVKPTEEIKKITKQPSFFGSIRKLFKSRSKVYSANEVKARNLFDDDDGTIDECDAALDITLSDSGMPFGLANSTLRSTYIHSIQKLRYREHRPLAQLMLINTVVNRLQNHVNGKGHNIPVFWLPPSKTPYPRRRRTTIASSSRLTSRSEPDLTETHNKPIFNLGRASRSQDFFPKFSASTESLDLTLTY